VRKAESYCALCDRKHENDHAFIQLIRNEQWLLSIFKCWRKIKDKTTNSSGWTGIAIVDRSLEKIEKTNLDDYVEIEKTKAVQESEQIVQSFDIIDNKKTIKTLTPNYDVYYIRAPMKLGKTTALIEYIQQFHDSSDTITIVSFRKTFTKS
jgi:hypothetical protein